MISQWRDQRGLGVYQALSLDQDNTRQLWKERMNVVLQVADGLAFLHSKRIIIRDLKPDNCGIDYQGVVKIFDFGLAVPIEKKRHDTAKLYQLTGKTGTLSYMAPENFQRKRYGYGVDVYSLAILIHEVLSLKHSFGNMSSKTYGQRICERAVRPNLDAGWPVKLRELLPKMWVGDPKQRLTAAEAFQSLSEIVQGPDQDLYPTALFSPTRWFPGMNKQEDSTSKISVEDNDEEQQEEEAVVANPAKE
jgi:serine/threonine protein kinase